MSSKKKIVLKKELIDSIDFKLLLKYIDWCEPKKYFELEAGKELYKLLGNLSTQVESCNVIDIGTYQGLSALALSLPSSCKNVISYDIFDSIPDNVISIKNKDNISIKYMDCTDDMDTLLESDLIYIDIDNYGSQEKLIIDLLEKYKYKGLVVLDDIHLNESMQKLWNSIKLNKHDISAYGHWSGTGLINFDPNRFEIVCE